MVRRKNALLGLSLCAGLVPCAALADTRPETLAPNQGHFICTAAINSDGTVATAIFPDSVIDLTLTTRLSTGTYRVAFKGVCSNVQIAHGWFRVVQPDSLQTAPLPSRACTTWDAPLHTSAIIVQCFDTKTDAPANTSFTISVSR